MPEILALLNDKDIGVAGADLLLKLSDHGKRVDLVSGLAWLISIIIYS